MEDTTTPMVIHHEVTNSKWEDGKYTCTKTETLMTMDECVAIIVAKF